MVKWGSLSYRRTQRDPVWSVKSCSPAEVQDNNVSVQPWANVCVYTVSNITQQETWIKYPCVFCVTMFTFWCTHTGYMQIHVCLHGWDRPIGSVCVCVVVCGFCELLKWNILIKELKQWLVMWGFITQPQSWEKKKREWMLNLFALHHHISYDSFNYCILSCRLWLYYNVVHHNCLTSQDSMKKRR